MQVLRCRCDGWRRFVVDSDQFKKIGFIPIGAIAIRLYSRQYTKQFYIF